RRGRDHLARSNLAIMPYLEWPRRLQRSPTQRRNCRDAVGVRAGAVDRNRGQGQGTGDSSAPARMAANRSRKGPQDVTTIDDRLLRIQQIHLEPEVVQYQRGREILARFPDAERV